jgi:hypothetical protein
VPHLTLSTDVNGGPIIAAWLNPSTPRLQAMKSAGLPMPAPIPVNFLVDTGASCTAVDEDIITALGVAATGQTPILTPTTGGKPENRLVYDVAVILYHADNSRYFHTIPVFLWPFDRSGLCARWENRVWFFHTGENRPNYSDFLESPILRIGDVNGNWMERTGDLAPGLNAAINREPSSALYS